MTSPITTVTLVDGTVAREAVGATGRMSALPDSIASLPSVATAPLPAGYENASRALATCSSIDECQEWAGKAQAMASYARQAKDETLRKRADRIQARAIRRCGELLRMVPTQVGGDRRSDQRAVDLPMVNRTQAASDAGLSEHQRKTALRVAAVPDREFVDQVESDQPPTVTVLMPMRNVPRECARAYWSAARVSRAYCCDA